MKIKQTYSINEAIFGEQEINFIVSDNYSDLFNGDAVDIETDIFIFNSNKQDLELKKFIQAVDELDFSIRQTSTRTQEDLEAMFFCLEATNLKVTRYCILYLGSISESNILFIGKIDASISGDDIVHNKADWVDDLGVQREYKFTALSIDIALTEEALFTDTIEDSEGNNIDNIYTRIRASSHSVLNAITVYPTIYNSSTPTPPGVQIIRHRGQVNLFDAINMYLDLASDIINEKNSISINFSFAECELGFEVTPTQFEFASEGYGYINKILNDHNQVIKTRLSATTFEIDSPNIYSTLMVHRGNIDPEVYNDNSVNTDWESEIAYSWIRFNNVGNLIFAIARALGCFVQRTYSSSGVVLTFVPRQSYGNTTSKYLIGASNASITAEVETNAEKTSFEEFGNYMYYSSPKILKLDAIAKLNEMTEEPGWKKIDGVVVTYENLYYKLDKGNIIEKLPATKAFSDTKAQLQKTDSNKIDLPISSTIAIVRDHEIGGGYNIFSVGYDKYGKGGWLLNTYINDRATELSFPEFINEVDEKVLSALNIYCTNPETSSGTVLRPIFYIYYKRGLANKEVGNLTEMLADIEQTEREVYKTTYNVRVPFWNSFANDESGSGASWKNAYLGGSLFLNEIVKRYNGVDFDEITLVNEYTIISIQRNLQKPETTLKLQLKSRFAFGYYDSLDYSETEIFIQEPNFITGTSESIITSINDYNSFRTYPIKTGETITEGDAVSLDLTGEIVKTKSQSIQTAHILGICTSVSGTTAQVLLNGIVMKDGWSWSEIGKEVFAVTNLSGSNLTQTGLFVISGSEDLTISVGRAINEKEIYVKPQQYKLA